MSRTGLDTMGIRADPDLESAVRAGLDDVEKLLRDAVRSEFAFVTEASRHLTDAGGKRFRPMVVLLAAQFADPAAPEVIKAATAIELTHLSTLYHDDVMDEAPLRRGAASANARWTNTVAILVGDYLFARASEITADLGPEATRILAQTIATLCEGQIRETVGPMPDDDPIEHYLRVISGKTASLIAASGRLGAMMAGADPVTADILATFGERFGVAFQLSDDIIDVASDSVASGKTPGTDLRAGVSTLPVLYTLRARDAAAERLRELMAAGFSTDAAVDEALELLRGHPGMGEARAELRAWVSGARECLAPLPDGPAKTALESLADFIVVRTG
ncbi:polyprenyl synthetase family protein [Frankia sp. CNm7]|uniref:Polyprenyl synthetase family protein n=1 Tax=Frankia nepalensis TaxID=1836974 RepID=A0A937RHX8_9ACTN|nr:polyprenyl synthetase family protein [Frankia nepalensis]MBL7496076.1 polyprenyl synthetase family protein [Frankia nepalensis]MBL7511135.1 polyprenyl synthetase family protein [Frankia nepalensis]MBL7523399.1 polyprenyl synthetase family protein [Frankia nepalensis]MBL7630680.1 polyprenyl synthetase family protein [Frankia nepalensis]